MSGYISKDFVHRGCGLDLNPDFVWEKVPYSVQKNIKRAEKSNISVKKVEGTQEDLEILRNMWYDPNDPNLPLELKSQDYMFIAYNDKGVEIGVIILLPVNNHLFLNNLAGNEEGKLLRVQDYLLWYSVNYFENSEYKYIDVGVSYRASLYEFFKKWGTISYPIIFNVPKVRFNIGLTPFDNNFYLSEFRQENNKEIEEFLSSLVSGREFTFVPDMIEARKIFNKLNIPFRNETFNFTDAEITEPFAVNLAQVFSIQFGALIVNMKIDDKTMWNEHKSLDVFKRHKVYSAIFYVKELFTINIAKRKKNIDDLNRYFALEDISNIKQDEIIPSAYYFESEFNDRYHNRLNDFGISHYYIAESNVIGLPIHQNMTKYHLEYLYAIYRGVLNLCSEWVYTDYYADL